MSFVNNFKVNHQLLEKVLGDTATVHGRGDPFPLPGEFSNEYIDQHETEMVAPIFKCQQANATFIKQGDSLFVYEVGYKVVGIQPDGLGLVALILERLI